MADQQKPTRKPRAPVDLGAAGRRLWRDVTAEFELGPGEIATLKEACRVADELDDLRAGLMGQPLTVPGSAGQMVAHPLLAEVRRHRDILARLVDSLSLPAGDEDAGSTPAQKRAARAASQRWRDRQGIRAIRGGRHGAA